MIKVYFVGASQVDDVNTQYYIRLYRTTDDRVYDVVADDFVDVLTATDENIPLDEVVQYNWSVDLPSLADGHYYYLVFDKDLVVVDNTSRHIYVTDNQLLADSARSQVLLFEHYLNYNGLRIVTEEGDPVVDAAISVISKYNYDTGNLDEIIDATTSDSQGGWTTGIAVDAPGSYVVMVRKPNQLGSVAVEIIVP